MQVLVGDHVVVVAHGLEPVDDREIGRELPGHDDGRRPVPGPHVEDRPEPGGVADPRTVAVAVVAGGAVFRPPLQLHVPFVDHGHLAAQHLRDPCAEADALVGVGEVAAGGDQHRDGRGGLLRAQEEDHVLFRFARPEPGGVDAALQVRHLHGDGGLPAAVGDRVLVEFDAAELRRRVAEAVVVAVPVEAGHAAHRAVVAFAVKPVGAGVDDGIADAGRAIASRGVPGGDDRAGCRGAARLARAVEHLAAQHRAGDARAVDLAVVEMGGEGAAFRRAILRCGPQKVGVSRRRSHPKLPANMAGDAASGTILERWLL